MRIFIPYTEIQPATKIAMIGYEYTPIETPGEFGYGEYFKQRWEDGQTFINVEHDTVAWPGAIEAIWECPELWCAYDAHLPVHRGRDIHHETTAVPIALAKISKEFIERTTGGWDKNISYLYCDWNLTYLGRDIGVKVHQHFPSIVNANPVLLN